VYSNETVRSFLTRARHRLDQELDAQTNFWSTSEMIEYMNEGMREVWASVRETHQNWFIRQISSKDGILSIGGRKYDTSLLRVEQGRQKLILPPDFYELTLFENVRNPTELDTTTPLILFEYANMTQRVFRNSVPEELPADVRVFRYRYDVVYGPEGPYIFVSPTLRPGNDALNLDMVIAYVAMPYELTVTDSFQDTGFTTVMVDAVLAYSCYAAVKKEDLSDNIASFKQTWDLKKELVSRVSSPKQTRDEETVEGYLESEILE
jgi:hypothetical protein